VICLVPATLTGVEIGCHIDLVSTACAHISVKCWRCRRAGVSAGPFAGGVSAGPAGLQVCLKKIAQKMEVSSLFFF
jgi:hypothetical protein